MTGFQMCNKECALKKILSATWLPHGQRWAPVKGAASLT